MMDKALVQKEIEAWTPEKQDELAAYLSILRAKRDPEHARVLGRRIDDSNPDKWLTLDAAKEALGRKN